MARDAWCRDWQAGGVLGGLAPSDYPLADGMCREWLSLCGGVPREGEGIMACLPCGCMQDGRPRRMTLFLAATEEAQRRAEEEQDAEEAGMESAADPSWAQWDSFVYPDLLVGNVAGLAQGRPAAATRVSQYLDELPCCTHWRELYGPLKAARGPRRRRHGLRVLLAEALGAVYWAEYRSTRSLVGVRTLNLLELLYTPALVDENVEPAQCNWYVLNMAWPWRVRPIPDPMRWWLYPDMLCAGQLDTARCAQQARARQ